MLPATLTSAEAQYISPNQLHISALLQFFIPLALDIYSLDDRQWLSFPSGAPWILLPAFEDFDTNRLLAAGDGIEYVMENLQDPELVESDPPLDEGALWQVQARAAGEGVSGLLFGFIEPQDDVEISAFITPEDGRFARLEITMLETTGDPERRRRSGISASTITTRRQTLKRRRVKLVLYRRPPALAGCAVVRV